VIPLDRSSAGAAHDGSSGRRARTVFLFVHLDKVVPPDHLVRQIDGLLDLDWVHKELAPYYSHTGRPSIDPVLMIRMLLIGYIFAIRSERRICAEIQVNLAYRWFCKLGIETVSPIILCSAVRGTNVSERATPYAGYGSVSETSLGGLRRWPPSPEPSSPSRSS
jgi:hypothetical protein